MPNPAQEQPTNEPEYDHPPLVEAVFEVFLPPDAGDVELGALREHLAGEYKGRSNRIEPKGAEVEVGPQGGSTRLIEEPPRWQFRSLDDQLMAQVGQNMCAVNVLPPYTHYVDYKLAIEEVFKRWLAATEAKELFSIGQRYINRVLLPPASVPRTYFRVYPTIPDDLGNPPFAMQVRVGELLRGAVILNLALQGYEGSRPAYLLDIYARAMGDAPSANWEAIEEWMDQAHEAVSEAFEFAITEESRDLFGRSRA